MGAASMSTLARRFWLLPFLITACGNTSLHGDSSSGGRGGATGSTPDGGQAAGGKRPEPHRGDGGTQPGAGGFTGGDGAFFGGDGGFFGGAGFFGAGGGFFGAGGGFFGAGGDFLGGDGGFVGAGGYVGIAGSPTGGSGASSTPVDPTCCEAIPFCRAGYDQVSGPGECNKGDICYEATACCSTIWCKAHPDEDAGVCARQAPPGVRYVSANASVCDHRAWTCPTNAYQYWDTCGCGCSQDPGCPASVDCTTAQPQHPLCTDKATCPYTSRAF